MPEYLTFAQLQKRVPLSRTWIYKQIRAGRFPRPIKFGAKSLWVLREVEDYLRERAADR